jgi:hypothetical protein
MIIDESILGYKIKSIICPITETKHIAIDSIDANNTMYCITCFVFIVPLGEWEKNPRL